MTFDPTELAWAAGLFEGEGCFHFGRSGGHRNAMCRIAMTDQEPLQKFLTIVGLGRLGGPYKSSNPRHKPYWVWQTTTFEHTQAVVALLWRHLSSRRKTAAKSMVQRYLEEKREARKFFKLSKRHTAAETTQMRALFSNGVSQSDIARMFERSQSSVSKIINGKRNTLEAL